MGNLLVVDGGRSRCRAAVIGPDGSREASGEGRGLPALGREGLPGVIRAVAEAVALCAVNSETLDAVVAGLAGMMGSSELAPVLADELVRQLGVGRVVITGDVVAAYAGALGTRAGVVVAAGTGAVAFGATDEGDTAHTDGWGHLLGDAGSGYWIGRRGLEAALRAHDGRSPGGSATLAGLAECHMGPLPELPRWVAASDHPVTAVAAFSHQVAEAAGRGDPVATAIWADAAVELATSAAACAHRLFPAGRPVPVSWSGGLFAAGGGDLLLRPFLERLAELCPDALPTPPAGDALAGAARLAAGPGPLARHVHDSVEVVFDLATPPAETALT